MTSVGEDYPKQQQKIREYLEIYVAMPDNPVKEIMLRDIRDTLRRADEALASGDTIQILKLYPYDDNALEWQKIEKIADDVQEAMRKKSEGE